MKLKNKVAIVTGASRGIGKAIALGFAKEGANIAVAARTETTQDIRLPGTISSTAQEVEALGSKALPIKCDVTNEESIKSLIQKTMDAFGQIDILVNNAGIAFPALAVETPLKRWDLVLRVNLTGAFLCSKAVLPVMMKQRSGHIINISSLAANERAGQQITTGLAYSVSKAGLDRLTFGLAAEVGQFNIAVNAIKPHGIVDSDGMRFAHPEETRKGWTTPELLVKCAVFLAAQETSSIRGVVATDQELSLWYGLS